MRPAGLENGLEDLLAMAVTVCATEKGAGPLAGGGLHLAQPLSRISTDCLEVDQGVGVGRIRLRVRERQITRRLHDKDIDQRGPRAPRGQPIPCVTVPV